MALAMACAASPGSHGEPDQTAAGRTVVELDVFSGRANPSWTLSGDDAGQVLDLLRNAPTVGRRSIENNLGYRGFVVEAPEVGIIRVQNGIVEVTGENEITYRSDPDRVIERWLLESGRGQLEESVYDIVDELLPR